MKEKTAGKRIILAAFIIIICLSGLFWILLEKFVDAENHENRVLSTRPELTVDSYKTYPDEYEKYFNDNMPFRNIFVSIDTAINYYVFNKSGSKKVAIGKDDWLFLADVADGDPISNYQGKKLLSEEELEAIAQNCLEMQTYLDELGKEFVVFIAPNKERIYYDKMPEKYGAPADTYRALQIVEYLRNNTDIRIVYPYDELMQAKEALAENIYYKADTHWNSIGGYIGAAALLNELGIEMPDIASDEITITAGDRYTGDLAVLLNLKDVSKYEDWMYTVEGYATHNIEALESDFYTVISYRAKGADSRKIYVCRDSFATAMAPYIGSQFTELYMRHLSTYTHEDFLEQDPDIFIYETIERYVNNLASFSIKK